MGVTITVDLGTSSPKEIARAAKFMLEFAGFQDPSVVPTDGGLVPQGTPSTVVGTAMNAEAAQHLVGARGSLGEPIDDNSPLPAAVFGQFQQVATPDGDLGPVGALVEGIAQGVADSFPTPQQAYAAAATRTLPSPPPGIEVDAHGVPWDNRIHAGSRAKIADGTWRQKRNLDPEVYKKVMDELRHTMGVERRAPQPPAPPVPQEAFAPHPPVPPIPVAPLTPETALAQAMQRPEVASPAELIAPPIPEVPPPPFAASAVPPAPPISSTPPVPASVGAATVASPGSPTPVTFPEFMKKVTTAFAAKTITQADITRSCQKAGLTALPMLAMRPDLIGDVANELGIAL